MSEKDNGGPAFPSYNYDSGAVPVLWGSGMTLRDWFAGQAVVPVLDNAVKLLLSKDKMMEPAEIAKAAYKLADAMLAERDKQ